MSQAGPILPADIAARPRYGSYATASPRPGEDDVLGSKEREPAASRLGGSPSEPPKPSRLIDRIVEFFAGLPGGGGDVGMALAGAVAESDGDEKALAIRLGLARKPGQRRVETIVAKLSRDDGIRELAAQHPGMSARAIAVMVGVSTGTARRALEQR